MGISYFLKCVSCYEKLENIDTDDPDEADEMWEELYEKLDPEFYLPWGVISVERLFKWANEHKGHGEIEFSAS